MNSHPGNAAQDLINGLSGQFCALPQVEAVALSGSRGRDGAGADRASDIDLYVYTRGEIALDERRAIVERCGGASRANLGATYWGAGDEWFDAASGIAVDVMFFDAEWMADQIARVLDRHQAAMGYTTCFWHTVRQSRLLFDRNGWFAALQQRSAVDYPEALRRAIVELNHPLLRGVIPAYANQVAKAVKRRDLVSINHRLAAFLASYFDCLFAANRLPHPGEKRLIEFATTRCTWLPEEMGSDLAVLLVAAGSDIDAVPGHVARLLDRLDAALVAAGLELPPAK